MSTPVTESADWRKSTFSNWNGSCVEVAPLAGIPKDDIEMYEGSDGSVALIAVNDPERCVIYTPAEWKAFLDGVQAGEFDAL